jgi:hypothetical protein
LGQKLAKTRATDYGTVILHWLLAGAVLVAVATGLRIACESSQYPWLEHIDWMLPERFVWTAHIGAAVVLVGAGLGYAVYLSRSGLLRRVKFNPQRIAHLLFSKSTRWTTLNVALYWGLYVALLIQILSGAAMYFDMSSTDVVALHWAAMCGIVGYVVLHVLCHALMGGTAQLTRIFRPGKLNPPAPVFDPFEVIAAMEQKYALAQAGGRGANAELRPANAHALAAGSKGRTSARTASDERRGPGTILSVAANPFLIAAAVGTAAIVAVVLMDRNTLPVLHIHRIAAAQAPKIDGEASDPIWATIPALKVRTEQGANFGGTGETTVLIKAVNDGERAYFLFIWEDPTRSLKQAPLQKRNGFWHVLSPRDGSERAFNEDKFSILFTKVDSVLAGDHTFHAGTSNLPGKLHTLSGHGLHYTTGDNLFVDVWEWKATSTNPSGMLDDDHFGPPAKVTDAQANGEAPYRGGFAPDPGSANYSNNFNSEGGEPAATAVVPLRLPKDIVANAKEMTGADFDPDHSDGENARWYLTEDDSQPYSAALDATIPDGTIIPGIVISGQYSGDRADVKGSGRWAGGRWVLEVVRPLRPHTHFDVALETGTFMRVAAFDHTRFNHTRHVRPLSLEVE